MSAPLVIVFVVDGLRPDAISAFDTPTIHRLRTDGVEFSNSHAASPTVTRVNAATLVTGAQPGRHGIVGNQIFLPDVDPFRAIDTASHRRLLEVHAASGGRLLTAPTLAERLAARGLRLAAVSSGSTGSALLTNHRAPDGVGVLVNGYLDPGKRVAWPDEASAAILGRFGSAPAKGPGLERHDEAVAWTQRVLREYVLPELRPTVVINWITEPDHSQHASGVGSPSALEALRHADRQIADVLAALDTLDPRPSVNVIVASDHGFTGNAGGVDVARELVDAGLTSDVTSADVVLASSGQAVGLHVAGHDAGSVERLVRFAQSRDWAGALFTAAREPGSPHGFAEGTFALETVHLANPARSPDLLVTFPWSSRANGFGVRGTDLACVSGGARLFASDHGGMSPWNVRNTLVAWGPAFKKGIRTGAPAGNVDVAPTVLALLGIDARDGMDGRVLYEALAGADPEPVAVETRTHSVATGSYRAALQISTVGGHSYVDKSWRIA